MPIIGLFACITLLLFGSSAAYAGQNKTGVLNKSKDQMISDLLQASINRNFWYSGDLSILNSVNALYALENTSDDQAIYIQKIDPAFFEYIYRTNGLPSPFSIHKWDRQITIGLGWQKVRVPDNKGHERDYIPFGLGSRAITRTEYFPLFEKAILDVIPSIKSNTGLDVKYYEPKDGREYSQDYARVRIIPITDLEDIKKRDNKNSTGVVSSVEEYLTTAIRVKTAHPKLIDAYYVPNADNSIAYAVCKIDPSGGGGQIRSLIEDCLIAIVGISASTEAELTAAYRNNLTKLLYCSKIRSGMTAYEVVASLKKYDECFFNLAN